MEQLNAILHYCGVDVLHGLVTCMRTVISVLSYCKDYVSLCG